MRPSDGWLYLALNPGPTTRDRTGPTEEQTLKNLKTKIAAGAALSGEASAGSLVVAREGLLSLVIRDHVFSGAIATESLLSVSICD